jgi:hypothetical protein
VKFLYCVPLLLAAGCSSFDRDWEAARPRLGQSLLSGGLAGCWEGTWHSDANGHEGGLRCIITRKEDSGFDARYDASYDWCIFGFTFEYTVPVTAERDGSSLKFHGSAELGCWIAGGLYEYEGRVEGDDYSATYKSNEDHGVFKMKRAK